MKKAILVAGATGNLGMRICNALVKKNATVSAIVRTSTDTAKTEALKQLGVNVIEVDFGNYTEIVAACKGTDCVVSAVAGLKDVIVDLQSRILDAAIEAGVARFIPSDFCTDYNDLQPGENRNFDLRKDFKDYIDGTSIKASSVYNGAFADIIKYNTPVLNVKDKSISYWGDNADWKLDFTTMDDTAAFTAEVALDDEAPRNLQIASFQVSPNEIFEEVKEITGTEFSVRRLSGMEEFAHFIKKQRAENPAGEHELYAKWQQSQYLYSMFSTHHEKLDNARYDDLSWTSAEEYLKTFVK